jgi:hypothetical protein
MVSKRLAVLLAIISCSGAFADNLYRYKNNEGGTVVDWHVPAKFAGRGYEVLSPLGEVVKVVPRQLSDSELNDKDLVERLKRCAEAERARLAEWDRFLLLRYSTVEDINAARDRALRELKIRLSILASNQRVARGRLETALSRLADFERRGEDALPQDLEAVEILRSEIAAAGRSIEEREGQVAAVTEEYARDHDRFAQLQDVVLLRRSLSRDRASRDN